MDLAFLYRRVSTGHQDTSLLAQEASVDAYVRALGYTVAGEYPDADISGSVPLAERPAGRRLLDDIARQAAGAVRCHVVAAKQDRIGRDTLDVVATVTRFWEQGVVPHFAHEGGALPRSPQNELLLTVKAGTAKYELDQIRQRTRVALGAKRARGERTGAATYGWDFADTDRIHPKTGRPVQHVVPNPEEQRWLAEMRRLRGEGLSHGRIADWLNERGVPTKAAGKILRRRRHVVETGPDGRPRRVAVPGPEGLYEVVASGQWTWAAVESALTSRLNNPA